MADEKLYFCIYNPELDKFLVEEADPETHHPYRWVEAESQANIAGIREDMLDGFLAGEFDTSAHILRYLQNQCPNDGIMIVPLNMLDIKRGKFDFKHGFKL